MTANCILERVSETRSTNDDLLDRWRTGKLQEPVALMAITQTAGKGRAGRVWHANPEDSLCFSMAFPFNRKPAELAGLSLLVGLATIEGIAQACQMSEKDLYQAGLRLKWPNDLLLKNAKLGGILIEGGQAKPGDPSWMVVGVGINVRNADMIEKILEPNGLSLKISAIEKLIPTKTETPKNEQICLAILASFEKHFQNFDLGGFAPYQKKWLEWDAFANQKVCITGAGKDRLEGVAKGVDTNGAFLLEQETKTIAIYAGDVSLRPQS